MTSPANPHISSASSLRPPDAASPDPNNPAGYLNAAYYECVLEGSSNG